MSCEICCGCNADITNEDQLDVCPRCWGETLKDATRYRYLKKHFRSDLEAALAKKVGTTDTLDLLLDNAFNL